MPCHLYAPSPKIREASTSPLLPGTPPALIVSCQNSTERMHRVWPLAHLITIHLPCLLVGFTSGKPASPGLLSCLQCDTQQQLWYFLNPAPGQELKSTSLTEISLKKQARVNMKTHPILNETASFLHPSSTQTRTNNPTVAPPSLPKVL